LVQFAFFVYREMPKTSAIELSRRAARLHSDGQGTRNFIERRLLGIAHLQAAETE
jgi:hypothetical protein